jgi:hypothetical protein
MDFVILTSVHTRYVAQLLQQRLQFHGAHAQIFTAYSSALSADIFIVLCAQIFPELPPADKRIIFQMEQSTSTRWFTPAYLDDLCESMAVLDYSTANISALKQLGISSEKMHYLPIGANPQLTFTPATSKPYDFVFYGDYYSSERRQKFVQALQNQYRVLILQDIFEEELFRAITSAKAVINLHYYENPLLETTRICECLSLGMPVLSEATPDITAYPEFTSAVTFFNEGSVDDLMLKARWFLENLPSKESIKNAAMHSEIMFNRHFDQIFTELGLIGLKKLPHPLMRWLRFFQS